MSAPSISATAMNSPTQSIAPDTRLHGPWLVLAWVAWGALTLLSLINFITSIVMYLAHIQTPCQPGSCVAAQPAPEAAQALHRLGLSISAYAALNVALVILAGLVFCAVAAMIVWRKPTDWMALLVTSTLITQGLFENNFLQSPFNDPSTPWYVAGLWLSYISPVQVLFLCALFPNGRFVPRWMGWLLAVISLVDVLPSFFPTMPFGSLIETLFVFSGFPLVAVSMIYRYRRVSTPIERQQTKWVVFGVMVAFLAFMAWFIPQILVFSTLSQPGTLYDIIGHPLLLISSIALPVCIGIAVLRYRLWDIDLLINRTLVYGSLTTLLAAVYFGVVIGLQSLTTVLTGQTKPQPVIIVLSTLLIAALFTPLRHRLQSTIDHRFYRRKYDAAKTLQAFGATLRSQVDLPGLNEQLLTVAQETMQPAHVSLWLRQSATLKPPETHN